MSSLAMVPWPGHDHGQVMARPWPSHGQAMARPWPGHWAPGQGPGPFLGQWAPGPWAPGPSLLGKHLTKKRTLEKRVQIVFFVCFLETKKMRDVRTIILAAVSRRDLCYVSENEGCCFWLKRN